ncbi:MAG: ElyC/SanA/YdcF family protein [Chloroflexota bacterium]
MTGKLILILAILAALIILLRLYVVFSTIPQTSSRQEVSPFKAAIVFGAGLWRDGSPTPILRDRIATAAELYFAGKVEKLLMSGDNRFVDYNEPGAMRDYALQLVVPAEDIVLDYAGRRTYDTCYRAKEIFQLTSAILVTQQFHLPRALYTCKQFGLTVQGVPADRQQYQHIPFLYWNIREILATAAALWEVHISHPLPVLGEPLPIFPQHTDLLGGDHE